MNKYNLFFSSFLSHLCKNLSHSLMQVYFPSLFADIMQARSADVFWAKVALEFIIIVWLAIILCDQHLIVINLMFIYCKYLAGVQNLIMMLKIDMLKQKRKEWQKRLVTKNLHSHKVVISKCKTQQKCFLTSFSIFCHQISVKDKKCA